MKNIVAVGILCLIAVNSAQAEPTFAAIIPLTGNASDQGEWARRGFEMAREQLKKSDNQTIDIRYEDSKGGEPASAVQAYKSMALAEKIPVVFTYGSGVGMALTPFVNADHVVQMGIATATPKYRSENDFTFRNFPSASLEADFLAHALIDKLGIKRLAILNIENDYGVGTAGAIKSAYTNLGGTVTYQDSFSPGESDFKSMLLRVKQSDAQGIYLAVYPADGALLLKQAQQLHLAKQFIGSVAVIGGKDFFQLAGSSAEGLLVASSIPAQGTDFTKQYDQLYPGEAPAQQIYVARAYDAFKVVAETLKTCKSADADCIKRELFKVKNYPGASGTFSFDSAGDIDATFALFRVRNRAFEAFK